MSTLATTIVTVPADSYDLVTLADLKADLNILDTSQDAFLSRAISKASAAASQYCNRVFAFETVADTFDLSFSRLQWGGEGSLQASRWPVGTITSLIEAGTALVQDTDYRIDIASGIIWRLGSSGLVTSWRNSPVVFTYAAGFDPIPFDLQDAATKIVQALQFNRTRDPMLRSENILSGLYAYTLFDPSTMPAGTADQVASTLDNYRVPVTG